MAFADPQSVTIDATPHSLPRTGSGIDSGTFTENDGSVQLTVSHKNGKRNRHEVRLTHSKVAPDPLISSQNIKFSMSVYTVVDEPITGYTVAEAKAVVDALVAFMAANSGSVVTKLLGGES